MQKMKLWNENTYIHFIQEGSMGSKIGDETSENTVTIKATRLKDYTSQNIDFLKLDIEGAESIMS
jgi:hypothetical protein